MHTSPFCVILRNIPLSLLAFTSAWIVEASALHNTPRLLDELSIGSWVHIEGPKGNSSFKSAQSNFLAVCSCFSANSGPRSVKLMKPKILAFQNPPAASSHLTALQQLYVAMPREPFKVMLRTAHQHQLLVTEKERKTMRAREHERGREEREG